MSESKTIHFFGYKMYHNFRVRERAKKKKNRKPDIIFYSCTNTKWKSKQFVNIFPTLSCIFYFLLYFTQWFYSLSTSQPCDEVKICSSFVFMMFKVQERTERGVKKNCLLKFLNTFTTFTVSQLYIMQINCFLCQRCSPFFAKGIVVYSLRESAYCHSTVRSVCIGNK